MLHAAHPTSLGEKCKLSDQIGGRLAYSWLKAQVVAQAYKTTLSDALSQRDAIRKLDVAWTSAELKPIEANSSRKEKCPDNISLDQCAPSRNNTTLTVSTRTSKSRNNELFFT